MNPQFEVIDWSGKTMATFDSRDSARSWVARNGMPGDAIFDTETDEIVQEF